MEINLSVIMTNAAMQKDFLKNGCEIYTPT